MNINFFSLRKALLTFLATSLILLLPLWAQAQCPTLPDVQVITTDVTCNGFDNGTVEVTITEANGYAGVIP